MKLAELQELEARWVMQTYARAPVEFVRGEGARLWDSDGKEYLDFLAGISVCSVGHCHPAVVEAVREQVGTPDAHLQPLPDRAGVRLAERLCESSLGGRAFLCNSGTEANECAIKLVRKHAHGRGIRSRRSWSSRAPSTAARWDRSRRRPGSPREDSFGPICRGSSPCRATTPTRSAPPSASGPPR